jgi:hypothetical protein
MRSWLAVGAVFGMVGSIVSGCSSASPPLTVSDYCSERAQAECTSEVVSLCEVQGTACAETRTSSCMSYATTAVETGTRTFNPNNVAACLSAIGGAYGSLGQTDTVIPYSSISGGPTDTNTVDYICDSVFQGQVAAMGKCTSDFDCSDPNNVCTPANGGAKTLVCAPLNQVQAGATCGAAGDVCVSGTACRPNANDEYTCVDSATTLGQQGAECKLDSDCDPSVAGFCDIYNNTGCQANLEFATKDCELYGEAK